jgi:hypothetical protein
VKRILAMLMLTLFLVAVIAVTTSTAFACGHHGNGHPQCNQGGSGGGPNKPPGQTNNPNPGK